jgi:hypothetical protein
MGEFKSGRVYLPTSAPTQQQAIEILPAQPEETELVPPHPPIDPIDLELYPNLYADDYPNLDPHGKLKRTGTRKATK